MEMNQKKILLKNKIDMANSKKLRSSKPPILNIFLSKIAIGAWVYRDELMHWAWMWLNQYIAVRLSERCVCGSIFTPQTFLGGVYFPMNHVISIMYYATVYWLYASV